ncbi:MAG: PAS domain S-box protein [Deltaproteobacteria bacterium]|nr:PAS domain S-box protein [Deltaproteobacteria bacterium]
MKVYALFLRILLIAAGAELLAMGILYVAGIPEGALNTFLDALMLTVFSAPFLYFFVVKEMAKRLSEREVLIRTISDQRAAIDAYSEEMEKKESEERERRIQLRRLEVLNRIGTSMLRESEIEPMLSEAAGDICSILGYPRCIVAVFGEPGVLIDRHDPDLPPAGSEAPFSLCDPDSLAILEAGKNVVVEDTRTLTSDPARSGEMERIRLGSYLGIPLYHNEEFLGVLCLSYTGPHAWTEDEIATAEAIAKQIAMAIRHDRTLSGERELAGRLYSLTNNIPGVIYRGLRDWSIAFIGNEVERLTGYASGEFLRGDILWKELIHPAEREKVKEAFRYAVRERRRVLRTEYRILHKDGSVRWVADRRQLVYDGDGTFVYVDGLLLDITDRKHAEEERLSNERRFRAIADTATDAIVSTDSAGTIVFFNTSAEKLFGYESDELVGRSLSLLVPVRYRSAHERGMARFLKTGEARLIGKTVELHGRKKDGTEFPIELSLATWKIGESVFFTGIIRDITARKSAEEELSRLATAVEQLAEAVVITDTDGTIQYVNPAFEEITGYPPGESVGRNASFLKSGRHEEAFYRDMWDTIRRGEVWTGHFFNLRKDGKVYEEDALISPVRNDSGRIVNYVAVKRDVTKIVSLEKQLQTAQRMEAVGTLAGGIAHDFNNALTGVLGFAELLESQVGEDKRARSDLEQIKRCAERASNLTRQLLTFARRQTIAPVHLNMNDVVTDMTKFVAKIAGERIEMKTSLAKGLPSIRADFGQMEQILMNLCLNARDAMPDGGVIRIETGEEVLGGEYAMEHPYVKPGRYVKLSVSDTGSGMDEKTRERAFDPFFTTKGPERGTGLGLSVVYGIVKLNNGYINLYSEPGVGTTFRIYFPAVDEPSGAVAARNREEPIRRGTETVLLAEDDEVVRKLAERTLSDAGYTVLAARNGREAVEICRGHREIALAVLDMIMPELNGKEAFEAMRGLDPKIKAIFTSGHAVDANGKPFVLGEGIPFLQKPYSLVSLVRKVREVLDTGAG